MDGLTIQEASARALSLGATPAGVIADTATLGVDVPLVVMTYLNPVMHMGFERFASSLAVNGGLRQNDSTRNLVFKPAETLAELTTFSDLSPGDLLLTGTPAGCALRVPPPPLRRLMQLLPERVLWKAFVKAQEKRSAYLKPGDTMTLAIRSNDRRLDLGEQQTTVRAA